MKDLTKLMIKSFVIFGLAYAVLLTAFDFLREKEFDVWKFLLDFLIFGFFMSLAVRYKHKKHGN